MTDSGGQLVPSNISFNNDTIYLNYSGVPRFAGEQSVFDVTFCCDPTPCSSPTLRRRPRTYRVRRLAQEVEGGRLIVRRCFVGRSKQSFGSKEQELIEGLKYPVCVRCPCFRRAWRGANGRFGKGGVSGDGRAALYF